MSASSQAISPPPNRVPAAKRSRWKIVLLALALVALLLGALWWWHNRAIRPVKLSSEEKAVVAEKLRIVHAGGSAVATGAESGPDEQLTYEKGKKEFEITERELNGLLNEHTNFGDRVQFELVPGAIHARVSTVLDEDLPIVGGKTFKARARFFIETNAGVPELVLDDLTVWGISLPNDWLGGLKGQNLLGEVLGNDKTSLAGIESLGVERGKLVIRLAD